MDNKYEEGKEVLLWLAIFSSYKNIFATLVYIFFDNLRTEYYWCFLKKEEEEKKSSLEIILPLDEEFSHFD